MNDVKDYRKSELKNYVIIHILLFVYIHYSVLLEINIFKEIKTQLLLEGNLKNLVDLILPISATYIYIFILDAIVPSEVKGRICNTCYICKNGIVLLFKIPGIIVVKICKPLVDKFCIFRKPLVDKLCKHKYYKLVVDKLWIPLPEETVFDDINNGSFTDKRFTVREAQIKYQCKIQQMTGLEGNVRKRKSKSMWHNIYSKYEQEVTVLITYRDFLLCRDLCVITTLMMISYLFFLLYLCYCKSRACIFLCPLAFLFFEMLVAATATRVKKERLVWNVISTDIHHP